MPGLITLDVLFNLHLVSIDMTCAGVNLEITLRTDRLALIPNELKGI